MTLNLPPSSCQFDLFALAITLAIVAARLVSSHLAYHRPLIHVIHVYLLIAYTSTIVV